MNIDWNEIKEKYPKAYNKFITENNLVEDITGGKLKLLKDCIDVDNGYDISEASSICYCDLEKLFDDNGYRIYYTSDNRYDISKYNEYDILETIFISEVIDKLIIKQQAILKTFEILEDR